MTDVQTALLVVAALFIVVAYVRPTAVEFYLGSSSYGPLISAMSIVAAFTGGGALLNTTGFAAKYGSWAFFDVAPAVVGLLFAAVLVLVGFFGKRFSASFFDIRSEVYDSKAVALHYVQVGFLYILVIAAQLRAVAVAAEQTGTPVPVAVGFCCVVVAVYAYRGFDAVTRTDLVQFLLMIPMYVVLAYIAFEPRTTTTLSSAPAATEMPLSLIFALCLPLLFLPVSQEIHQRGAAAATDRTVSSSYIIAAIFYGVLGSLLVLAFSRNPHLTIPSLLDSENRFAAVVVAVGFFSAILSTLDTSTNVASHAVQKLHPFRNLHPALIQVVLLVAGGILFLYFKTVLSLILFALFLYMAGPAFTFFAIYAGVHPRRAAAVGATFCILQSFVHFRMAEYAGMAELLKAYTLNDPLRVAIYFLLAQLVVLFALLVQRRFQ